MEESRPWALYIEQDPELETRTFADRRMDIAATVKLLSTKYNVETRYNLLDVPEADILAPKNALLLTHLQQDDPQHPFTYAESVNKLHRIHLARPTLAIVVYTYAHERDISSWALKKGGITAIIRRLTIHDDVATLQALLQKPSEPVRSA